MEAFKLKHFKKNHPDRKMPWFYKLKAGEARRLRQCLIKNLGLSSKVDSLRLITFLDKCEAELKGVNSLEKDFDLLSVFRQLGIQPGKKVFINWYRFDNIDCMYLTDLSKYFEDIWYPGSDDIDIFDSTVSWIVSISHEGYIKYLKL